MSNTVIKCKLPQETVAELRADAAVAAEAEGEEEGAAVPRGSRGTRNSGRSSERGVRMYARPGCVIPHPDSLWLQV